VARRICHLDETPIGKILFGRQGAQRKTMSVDLVDDLPQGLINLNINIEQPLWQRCSIFEFSSGPIMITETFLPDSPIYDGLDYAA
jgi:chorismate-pyruvate lyase